MKWKHTMNIEIPELYTMCLCDMEKEIRKMRCSFCIKELVLGYVNPDKDYKLCDTCAFRDTGNPYYPMNNKGDSMLENPSFKIL